MKPDRFRRMKSVVASSAIAVVVAALVMGLSSLVFGPTSASPEHVGFGLASDPSSFTITSNIYPSPACSGTPALVYPGTPRCAVFTVKNLLNVGITVRSITTTLDSSFPLPPPRCRGTNLTRPTFTGSFDLGASATANLPGVPIELNDSGSNQNVCENLTYHFVYSGTARYTDSTSTNLTSSPNPSTSGQSVTFTATVTAANPGTDSSLPSGTVRFYKCPTSVQCAFGSPNHLGNGTIGAGGVATYTTSSLPVGTTYVEAVYPPSGTDFNGSVSNVVTQVVNP
jgi:hypothetical protein